MLDLTLGIVFLQILYLTSVQKTQTSLTWKYCERGTWGLLGTARIACLVGLQLLQATSASKDLSIFCVSRLSCDCGMTTLPFSFLFSL